MQNKNFLILSVLSACLALPLAAGFAEDAPPASPPPAERGDRPASAPAPTPAERAERLGTQVKDLTAEQKKQIEGIFAASAEAMAALRADKALSPEERQAQSRKIQDANRSQIEAVLTEAQRAQWKEARAKAMEPQAPQQPLSPGARTLRRYTSVLKDLSDEQQKKILAIADEAVPLLTAARANEALNAEQREAELERIQAESGVKIMAVLTTEQRATWDAMIEAARRKEMEREFNLRPGETLEQKRARVLKPFEEAVPSLTPAQKDLLWPIASSASDIIEEIVADDSRSADQKQAILRRVNASTDKKVGAVLDKDQFALWQKARAAAAK